jgi:hypothetical protein
LNYFAAILNSIVLVFEAVDLDVTTTDTVYKTPGTIPVIVTGVLKLVDEMLLVKVIVLSSILIILVSIVTPLLGIAASLTSIFCEAPTTE